MCRIMQGCAFWGLKYLILTFDPIYPQNVKFCPQNSNFKPKWWNMKVQVYQKLLNQWTWKFDTMLRTWNSVLRCNMMTSQQIQYSRRPPYWKSSFGYISTIYCSINVKFGTIMFRHRSSDQISNFRKFKMRTAAILIIVSSLYLSHGSSDFNEIWCAATYFGFKDGHVTKYQNIANSKWRMVTILKIVFWLYFCDTSSN